jgi:hypothetical protein
MAIAADPQRPIWPRRCPYGPGECESSGHPMWDANASIASPTLRIRSRPLVDRHLRHTPAIRRARQGKTRTRPEGLCCDQRGCGPSLSLRWKATFQPGQILQHRGHQVEDEVSEEAVPLAGPPRAGQKARATQLERDTITSTTQPECRKRTSLMTRPGTVGFSGGRVQTVSGLRAVGSRELPRLTG